MAWIGQQGLRNFVVAEDGAATVEWVVLTAALVGLTMALVGVLTPSLFEDGALAIKAVIDSASGP